MTKRKKIHVVRTRNRESSVIVYYKFVIYVFLVAIFGAFFLKLVTPIISNTVNVLGISSFFAKGGEDDNSGTGSSGSGSSGESRDSDDDSGSGSSQSNSSGSSGTSTSTGTTNVFSDDDEDEKRTSVGTKPGETRTEIRLSEEERIRARTKDGQTRIDITSGGVKTRFEIRDDRIIIKAETEDGVENELEDDTILKIEDRLGASGIKIATAGAEKFLIMRASASAVTSFPLSIDLATNTLTVTTPAGPRQVAVLPDQAVQNLLAANVISQLVSNNSLVPQEITSVGSVIALGEQNGIPVYQINGILNQRLLGFIPVVIEKTVTVSAETGEIESTQIPLVDRVLDIISF